MLTMALELIIWYHIVTSKSICQFQIKYTVLWKKKMVYLETETLLNIQNEEIY